MFRKRNDTSSAHTEKNDAAPRKASWFGSRTASVVDDDNSVITASRKSSWFGGDAAPSPRKMSVGTELSTRLDVDAQLMGDLWKKDTAGTARWSERFFVLKDGFLLYYEK